jgi:hypothetical protein
MLVMFWVAPWIPVVWIRLQVFIETAAAEPVLVMSAPTWCALK